MPYDESVYLNALQRRGYHLCATATSQIPSNESKNRSLPSCSPFSCTVAVLWLLCTEHELGASFGETKGVFFNEKIYCSY